MTYFYLVAGFLAAGIILTVAALVADINHWNH